MTGKLTATNNGNGSTSPWWVRACRDVGFPIVAFFVLGSAMWVAVIVPGRDTQKALIDTNTDLMELHKDLTKSVEGVDESLKELTKIPQENRELIKKNGQMLEAAKVMMEPTVLERQKCNALLQNLVDERQVQTELLKGIKEELKK